MKLRIDTATVTHLDHPGRGGVGKHRMIASQFFHDLLDGRFNAEQGTTLNAGKGLFFIEGFLGEGRIGQVELGCQRNRLFRAHVGTKPALQAGVFLKAQLRQIRIVAKRAGGAKRHTGQTQRAGVGIHQNRAIRRAHGQGDGLGCRVQCLCRQSRNLPACAQG